MLSRTALACVNHLLTGASWARSRLQPFAGQTARLALGPLSIPIGIDASGLLVAGDPGAEPAVSISLDADAPLRLLTDRQSLFSSAHIVGAADLAETLGFVLRNLRWDAEDDLSRLVGDIAARRVLQGGQRLVQWQLRAAKNLANNVTEYLAEENHAVARRRDLAGLSAQAAALHDDCARIEQRLERLEHRC
ncbi:MAG: hypothetical protein WAZ34_07620 [Rhodocyclaceae bacterium]